MTSTTENMEIKGLKAQMEGLVLKVKQVEEQRGRADKEVNAMQEEREVLQRRLEDQEGRHETQRGTQQHIFQSTPLGVNNRPPNFPLLVTKASSWAKISFPAGAGVRPHHTAQHQPWANHQRR